MKQGAVMIGKRVTRPLNVSVYVGVAAQELAAAVYSVTNLDHANLGVTDFVALYQGAYSLILSIMRGNPVTGEVPLPIFQLLAALRPRVIDLGGQASYSLRCIPNAMTFPSQPPVPTTEDYSEFTRRAAAIGGVLIDLSEISTNMLGPYPAMGYPNVVSVGATLGPLNIYAPISSRYNITRILTLNAPATEQWMRLTCWAASYSDTHDYENLALNFINGERYYEVTPGSILLSTALQRADIVGSLTFKFPAVDVACLKAFIDSNLAARDLANGTSRKEVYHYDLKAALVVASGIGLRAGQVAFNEPYNALSSYQLPQDIVEACSALPSFRNGVARVPYVYTKTAGTDINYAASYADGTAFGVTFLAKADPATGGIGISNAEMSLSSSAFYNNTFTNQAVNTALTWAGVSPAWGASNVTVAEPPAVNWSSLFKNTIANGPLARPVGNKVMTALNFTDLTAGRYLGTDPVSKKQVAGYANVRSFGGGLQGPNLAILVSLPLLREALSPEEVVSEAYHQTPNDQIQQRILDPAVAATSHTVSEDSAKYTELQQFFQNLSTNGLGGDALFGDIVRKSGQRQFLRRAAKALGFNLLGKTLIAASCPPAIRHETQKSMHKKMQQKKGKNNPSSKKHTNKPSTRKARGISLRL